MNIADFVSNEIEVVAPGAIPVHRIREAADYDFAARGVTHQFLGDAKQYYDLYTRPHQYRRLYGIAFDKGAIQVKPDASVLDIGTGGGNSVFAIRELVPEAQILGVDISQPLLELCAKAAVDEYAVKGGLSLLVADLYDLKPKANSVDLISGSSILHHMLDPEALILHVMTALAPGGYAVFNEPIEEAHGLLRAIFAGILEDSASHAEPLPEPTAKWMQAYIADFDARRGIGTVKPNTQWLDDKWFFTRSWFTDVARKAGCSRCVVAQPQDGGASFWGQFAIYHRLFGDKIDPNTHPAWVKRRFQIFDESLSDAQRRETSFNAVVVMQKS